MTGPIYGACRQVSGLDSGLVQAPVDVGEEGEGVEEVLPLLG